MTSVATMKGPRRTSRPGEEGINCHERSGRESSASDRGWNGHRAVFVVGNPLTSVGTAGHDRPRPPLRSRDWRQCVAEAAVQSMSFLHIIAVWPPSYSMESMSIKKCTSAVVHALLID